MSYWNKIYRLALVLVCILAVIALLGIFVPRFNKLAEYQGKKAKIQEENRKTAEATRELKDKQDQFLTKPRFVERTAREAGMIKDNETVFKFTNRQATTSSRITE